jgi:hypothetical protein
MTNKTFILGVGAQKSGTTWLYSYLNTFDCVDFGMMKEYHVWDARQDPQLFRIFNVDEGALFRHRDKPRFPKLQLKYAMQNVEGFYGFYFQSLLERTGKTITGDITPSYCALTAETLLTLKQELEDRGFNVRVVFLMRDPVERIWSSVRMERRIALNNGTDPVVLGDETAHVAEFYASPAAEVRTDYPRTIENIEAAFARKDIFYGFYESLFTKRTLRDISAFLGVPMSEEHTKVRVNVTERTATLSEDLRQQIALHYADVYAFCNDRFPETRTIWRDVSADL